MTNTVIHHSADFDGLFCREIARKFLPDAKLIGWDFNDKKIPMPEGTVYILDLSPDCLEPFSAEDSKRIIWIDHHKTAIDKWPNEIPGYRIDGVAACRLAYQWFAIHKMTPNPEEIGLPDKEHYVDRKVNEPYAVRLAGEYDIWDKRDPSAELFQHGLRSFDLEEAGAWSALLTIGDGPVAYVQAMLDKGKAIQYAKQQEDASIVGYRSFLLDFEGLRFLALNTARCNSLTFASRDNPETGHDALMGFYWNGVNWTVSMYHASHRKDLDLSAIAAKYGGGGHRGACGFPSPKVPWIP